MVAEFCSSCFRHDGNICHTCFHRTCFMLPGSRKQVLGTVRRTGYASPASASNFDAHHQIPQGSAVGNERYNDHSDDVSSVVA
eukprot:7969322-Karenia_brevis.AAC.1